MRQSTKIWLLVGIMLLASFLRLYHITTVPPGLYPDEAMDGNNALEVIQTGHFQSFYVEDNGREGLYVNILVFFIKALGNKPWVVRLPAAIAGIATVLGMYFLVAELFAAENSKLQAPNSKQTQNSNGPNPKPVRFGIWKLGIGNYEVALLAAFLLATSFWHINFSRIGFRAILAPLCLTWALYWFLKAVKGDRRQETGDRDTATSGKNQETKKSLSPVPCSMFLAALAGIAFGAGFYTYIAYRVSPLLFLLFIPFFRKYPDFWKKTLLFVIVTIIVALPIGLYFLHNPADFFGRTSEIAVTNSANPIGNFALNLVKTALMFNIRGDGNWRHNVSGAPELWWPVGILFAIGILYGIYALRQSAKRKALVATSNITHNDGRYALSDLRFAICLIFSWLLLAALPAAASNDGIPHALRSILMLPPAIMLAAIGGIWTYGWVSGIGYRVSGKRIANLIAVIFVVAVACYAYYDYFVVWAGNPNVPGAFNADYVAIGNQMNALPQATQKYVVVNAGGVLARGIPVPAETVMFVTDSFTTSSQLANHVTYLLPDQTNQIPVGTPSSTIFYVN